MCCPITCTPYLPLEGCTSNYIISAIPEVPRLGPSPRGTLQRAAIVQRAPSWRKEDPEATRPALSAEYRYGAATLTQYLIHVH